MPRRRLKNAVLVDQKGVAAACGIKALQQRADGFHVDGCAQNEAARTLVTQHGNDEVRHVAIAHEHIADIDSPPQHGLKPFRRGIIGSTQIKGAHIGNMFAVHANDTHIRKGTAVRLHDGKNGAQARGIAQFRIGMRKRQRPNLGNTLRQKSIQRPVLAVGDGLQTDSELFIVQRAQAIIAEQPQRQQRRHGQQQQKKQQATSYPRITALGHIALGFAHNADSFFVSPFSFSSAAAANDTAQAGASSPSGSPLPV